MQGAMFTAPEPWPIFAATVERELSTFVPPQPAGMPDPETWMARLGELPLLAQPGERWLYHSGSQVLGVLALRARARYPDVLHQRVLGPLGMNDTAFYATDPSRLSTAYANREGRLEMTDPPDGQWGYGPSILDDGVYTWEGGLGTAWSNVPSQDLTVVVLTQRAADEAGMPAVCDDVLTAARATA